MQHTFDSINDATGFANGEKFTSAHEVLDYFTAKNIADMFSGAIMDQGVLDEMAVAVIDNLWWCDFPAVNAR